MWGFALHGAAGGTLPYAEFVDNNLVPPKVFLSIVGGERFKENRCVLNVSVSGKEDMMRRVAVFSA